MAPRRTDSPIRPSTYESLIDAERDAMIQVGRTPNRADLVRALRAAAPALAPRQASRAVDHYISQRGGLIPTTTAAHDRRTGWIDDLLDAERARATHDDRPVTLRALRRAVRQATPDLSPRQRRAALDDYLHRRAGRPVRSSRLGWLILTLVLVATAVGAWVVAKFVAR